MPPFSGRRQNLIRQLARAVKPRLPTAPFHRAGETERRDAVQELLRRHRHPCVPGWIRDPRTCSVLQHRLQHPVLGVQQVPRRFGVDRLAFGRGVVRLVRRLVVVTVVLEKPYETQLPVHRGESTVDDHARIRLRSEEARVELGVDGGEPIAVNRDGRRLWNSGLVMVSSTTPLVRSGLSRSLDTWFRKGSATHNLPAS